MTSLYDAMVEAAAERAKADGCVDLVSIAEAAELGFNAATFQADVERAAAQLDD